MLAGRFSECETLGAIRFFSLTQGHNTMAKSPVVSTPVQNGIPKYRDPIKGKVSDRDLAVGFTTDISAKIEKASKAGR
jgi:hypothetical protein